MSATSLPRVPNGADLQRVMITVNQALEELDWLLNGFIDNKNIKAGSITANEIKANTITANEIKAGTITADEIAAGSITANEIAANTITGDKIAANTIEAGKLLVSKLSAISADLGTVTAGSITSNTTVNVGTDATIGKKLHMNPNDFGNGIDWGNIEIYIDPGGASLRFIASGGVYANGKRIDV